MKRLTCSICEQHFEVVKHLIKVGDKGKLAQWLLDAREDGHHDCEITRRLTQRESFRCVYKSEHD